MPRFLLSKKKLAEQYKIASSLADMVSYSAKTNYEVASLLEQTTGCFFSLHSMESLESVKDKKRIWFLAQAWDEKEIASLFKAGVENFIVDNEADLNALLSYLKTSRQKANLLLRLRLKEHTIHTGKYFVFGMYSEQINSLIPQLRKNPSIGKLGIHFHRKTQNISEWALKQELQDSISVWQNIDYVSIGGGIPVRYKNFTAEVLPSIFSKIKELRQWLNSMGIKMIIEPGRFLAASPVKLETTIKSIYDENIIVDASVYNSAMDTFVASIRLEVEGELSSGKAYTIKGQTPCSMDIFRYRVFLSNPKVGDKVVFLNAGAYNFSSDFCCLKKIPTVVID
ncbi:MAG: decarboxylase [Candidatus Woesearchaeota archaeon]